MIARCLVVRVTLHDRRYHGEPEWPPAPARLFQAVVAGAGPQLADPDVQTALRWWEGLEPPVIGVPRSRRGAEQPVFVPNNDLDQLGGDPERVAEIRVLKRVRPRLLADDTFVYAWTFDAEDEVHCVHAQSLVERLYQFGRGVDQAFATAETVDPALVEERWLAFRGEVHRPTPGGASDGLACPTPGTFDSLERRHVAQGERFRGEGRGRSATAIFAQPPKPWVRRVPYDSPPHQIIFELRGLDDDSIGSFAPIALEHSHDLVIRVRDGAVARLRAFGNPDDVDSALIGRRPGASGLPATHRVRIVPLPSIGHPDADPRVRRLLVEIPQAAPVRAEDIRWAFSGLTLDDLLLVETTDRKVADRYLESSRTWHTVTPAVLSAIRRRIDPTSPQPKGATERNEEESAATAAVRQALRHAGVRANVVEIDVRREPLLPRGARAEAFAAPPRFQKERLWHVALTFDREVQGPMVIGDGRFLGLGVFAPARVTSDRAATTVRR